jgi:hypothetical protein
VLTCSLDVVSGSIGDITHSLLGRLHHSFAIVLSVVCSGASTVTDLLGG